MAVIPLGIDRADQITDRVADALPAEQFVRELLYNSIQAVQRAGGGDAHVDYVELDYVLKLRFWDTGDGMGAAEMVDRLGKIGAADRTGENFGVGAKVSLRNISPHGAVFISLRDGTAHELILADEGHGFGLVRFTDDSDLVAATTRSVDLDDPRIPVALRKAGHGTVVIVLGRSAEDATAYSLRTGSDKSDWWLATAVNSRFCRFPAGVSVHVASYRPSAGSRHTFRAAHGTAVNADHYVTKPEPGQPRDVDLHGAKGTVHLKSTIPATAYWWVLPNKKLDNGAKVKKDIIGYYRVGNQVRVCHNNEVYLESSRALRTAGVWTNQNRVQIHIVPDESVTVAPDLGRTDLRVDGVKGHQALDDWCEELATRLPAQITALMKSSRVTRKGDAAGEKIAQLYNELAGVFVRSNRGRSRGDVTGDDLVTTGPGSRKKRAAGTSGRKLSRLRHRIAHRRGHHAGDATSSGQAVHVNEGGAVSARRASVPPIEAPSVRWVNTGPEDRSLEFASTQAGCYEASSNVLVLNAEFIPLTLLVKMYTDKAARVSLGSASELIKGKVYDRFEDHMRSGVAGSMVLSRGDRDRLKALLTDEALTVLGASVGEVSKRVNVDLGNEVKAGLSAVSLDGAT